MSTRDDYLWDRTGPADLEVARFERLLARFGHRARPLRCDAEPVARPSARKQWAGVAALVGCVGLFALAIAQGSGDPGAGLGEPEALTAAVSRTGPDAAPGDGRP